VYEGAAVAYIANVPLVALYTADGLGLVLPVLLLVAAGRAVYAVSLGFCRFVLSSDYAEGSWVDIAAFVPLIECALL